MRRFASTLLLLGAALAFGVPLGHWFGHRVGLTSQGLRSAIGDVEAATQLAEERQLFAFRHNGFWQCMDTLRDVEILRELYTRGGAPWVRE